jgi:hypothetical protein
MDPNQKMALIVVGPTVTLAVHLPFATNVKLASLKLAANVFVMDQLGMVCANPARKVNFGTEPTRTASSARN